MHRPVFGIIVTVIVLVSSLFFYVPTAKAADVYWVNTDGGNWNATENWSTGVVPGSDDNVHITADGTYTVTVDTPVTATSLMMGSSSGTQTLDCNYALTLSGTGTVISNGTLNLVASHFNTISTLGGVEIPQDINATKTFQRGDANSSSGVTIANALFIAQNLA